MQQRVNPIDRLVGQRVRLLRKSLGMSQSDLAAQLSLTYQQLQKYEKGTNRISASKLYEIAVALGVQVTDLFEDAVAAFSNSSEPVETEPPSDSDLQIAGKLNQVSNLRLKRAFLALINAAIAADKPAAGGPLTRH